MCSVLEAAHSKAIDQEEGCAGLRKSAHVIDSLGELLFDLHLADSGCNCWKYAGDVGQERKWVLRLGNELCCLHSEVLHCSHLPVATYKPRHTFNTAMNF